MMNSCSRQHEEMEMVFGSSTVNGGGGVVGIFTRNIFAYF